MAYGKIRVDTLTYDNSGSDVDVAISSLNTGTPTTITVADESSDTTCNVAFFTGATGDLAPKTGTNLTFNSNTGALTATSFVGAVSTAAQTAITSVGQLTSVDIAGPYKQTVVAITQSATPTVDLSTGNYFTLTQNANVTSWTFSNPPASRSFSFVIELANVSYTTAWTLASGTIKWPADTAPTLSASKTHLIILNTDDGGTTYRASSIVDYTT